VLVASCSGGVLHIMQNTTIMGKTLKQMNNVKRLENRQLKILNDGLSRFFSASGKRSSSMRSNAWQQQEKNAVCLDYGDSETLTDNVYLKKSLDSFSKHVDIIKSASSKGKHTHTDPGTKHRSLRNEIFENCRTHSTSSRTGGRCKDSTNRAKRRSRKRSQVEALFDGLTPIYSLHSSARRRLHALTNSNLQSSKHKMTIISKVQVKKRPKQMAKIKKLKDAHNSETFVCFPSVNQNHSTNLQLKKLYDGLSHKYDVNGERMRKSLHFYTYPAARIERCVQSAVKDKLLNTRNSQTSSHCEDLQEDTCEVNPVSMLLCDGSVNGFQNDFHRCKVDPKRQISCTHNYKGQGM